MLSKFLFSHFEENVFELEQARPKVQNIFNKYNK